MNIASRADSGQWQFSSAKKFCCPPNMRETKRESREARSGYRITCPRGIQGDLRTKTETEREQLIAGELPKTLTLSVHQYHACNLSLAQYFLFETFLCFKLKPLSHAFLSFCTALFVPRALFSCQYLRDYISPKFSFYNFTSKSD